MLLIGLAVLAVVGLTLVRRSHTPTVSQSPEAFGPFLTQEGHRDVWF